MARENALASSSLEGGGCNSEAGPVCCFSKICTAAICRHVLGTEKIHSNVGIFLVNEIITMQNACKIFRYMVVCKWGYVGMFSK